MLCSNSREEAGEKNLQLCCTEANVLQHGLIPDRSEFKSIVSAITYPGINSETVRVAYFLQFSIPILYNKKASSCFLGSYARSLLHNSRVTQL